MSHGADSEDLASAIGQPIPCPPAGYLDTPVMFIALEPGGDYGNDELIQHPVLNAVAKRVPTRHYYWSPPKGIRWPISPDEVTRVPGPFFAFILASFGFRNAYFTNVVKCRLWDDTRLDKYGNPSPGEVDIKPDKRHHLIDSAVRRNCVARFLAREIEIHKPAVAFVFGGRAMEILRDEPPIDADLLVQLDHYAVVNRNMKSASVYSAECEAKIRHELARRGIHSEGKAV
jgi:hypothetical protein